MTPAMFVIFYNIHKGAHHEFVTQTQGGAVMYYFNVLMRTFHINHLKWYMSLEDVMYNLPVQM